MMHFGIWIVKMGRKWNAIILYPATFELNIIAKTFLLKEEL